MRQRGRDVWMHISAAKGTRVLVAMLSDWALWMYLLIALAVYVVMALVVGDRYREVHSWARLDRSAWPWPKDLVSLTAMLVGVFLLLAFAVYMAHRSSERRSPYVTALGTLYFLTAILFGLVGLLVYRARNFSGALWASVAAFVVVLVLAYAVWMAVPVALLFALPVVVLSGAMVYHLAWMARAANVDMTDKTTYALS